MNSKIKAELAFAFSQLHEEDLALVPSEIQKEVAEGYDEKTFASFDIEKPFTSQELSDESLEILSQIFKEDD